MQLLALAALASFAAAQDPAWALYCGSSCSDGTLINSGTGFVGTPIDCTPLGATYDYCYLESDGNWFKATIAEIERCTYNDGHNSPPVLYSGECTPQGAYTTYRMIVRA